MGYMIEITEKKAEKLSEHIEESLRHMGKAMQCVESWMEDGGFGERGDMGYRYGMRETSGGRYGNYGSRYGNRDSMGYRDDEDWDDDDDEMGERRNRRRRSNGRYY